MNIGALVDTMLGFFPFGCQDLKQIQNLNNWVFIPSDTLVTRNP